MKAETKPGPAMPKRPYTPSGDAQVESRIAADQQLIGSAVVDTIDNNHFCALVLIGGYARGEGGYVYLDGRPAPFNDYDYFLIVKGMGAGAVAALRPIVSQLAERLSKAVGVEVDLAILRREKLGSQPASLMFAEMLWGHKVVAGDPHVLDAMAAMPFEDLKLGEFTRLMLNRGSLLLLNQQAINTNSLSSPGQRELFLKYLFKAMLACGDARLAALGLYHPSYAIKWQRLQRLSELPDDFLQHYKLALDAKFNPDFTPYTTTDLQRWQQYFVQTWSESLAFLEGIRLGKPIGNWHDYASSSIDKGQGSKTLSSVFKNLAITLRDYGPLELLTNIRWSMRYPRERLISVLPYLLRSHAIFPDSKLLRALGKRAGNDPASIESIFLGQWHRYS